ncbi:hypothetical protein ERO13_A12G101700v2 [Gossypium hirsutum]|nr:hypothetical protein ERO13_A12G101700v2 [Gossypium hirsutum]
MYGLSNIYFQLFKFQAKHNMAFWSAENATKAYLRALKMGKRGKEPDVSEFISAMAAGNNAQLMVMTCAGVAGSTALALIAAARQTGGKVVCILNSLDDYVALKTALGNYRGSLTFVIGDAKMVLNDYKTADFVLIDCNIDGHKEVLKAAQEGTKHNRGALIVGYNALHKGHGWNNVDELKTHFLPIGDGLLVIRKAPTRKGAGDGFNSRKRSRWVVKIDKWTGEEHVFRITSPCF